MKYCEAKTVDERWTHVNAVRPPTGLLHHITTTGTYQYEKQPEPELGKSEVALALINRLPDDVLCSIFAMHCCETTDTVRLPFNRSNVPPQIAISHVCSVWRDLIFNMPFLWNNFEVFIDHAKDGDTLMNIVHYWLFRTSSLPCSLTLVFKVDDGTFGALSQERWYCSIIKHLISQSRFRRLSTPWSSHHWTKFLQLPTENLSCIEDLHICCINPPSISNSGVQAPLDGFKKLTKLTSLRLNQSMRRAFDQMIYSEDPVFAYVPWHQLRHIHLSILTPVLLCFTILQRSSMVLETCTFVVSDCYGPWADIQSLYAEPLYCPELMTLDLESRLHPDHSDHPPILDQILLWIKMPNLKTLGVGSSNRRYQPIISSSTLVAMQDVSNMQLKEFAFYHHACSIDVGHLLTTFPSLKRIEVLGRSHFYNDTIDQLGSGLIAPCLEELVINCCYIDLGKLLRMVQVRSNIGKPVNRDEWQVAKEPTSFRYVKLYRFSSSVAPEYAETIEEINRYDVQLIVEKWRREVISSRSHFHLSQSED